MSEPNRISAAPPTAPPAAPPAALPDAAEVAAPAEASVRRVSRWAWHRRLYDWVLSLAHSRHSLSALFVLSFAESSFFPVPPDVLLGPLCLGNRRRSMGFAAVATAGSVSGAYLGYLIGYALIGVALMFPGIDKGPVHDTSWTTIHGLSNAFTDYGQWFVFVAALTPIPFKLLTITAGFAKMNLLVFTLACLVGRSLRFFAVAGLFWWIGPKATPLIDRHFNWLCLLFVVLLVGGFAALKLLH